MRQTKAGAKQIVEGGREIDDMFNDGYLNVGKQAEWTS